MILITTSSLDYKALYHYPYYQILLRLQNYKIMIIVYNIIISFSDYKTGFGGEFGVQTDRVDKNAVGWEHNEKVCIKENFESHMEFLTIGDFFFSAGAARKPK